MSQNKTQRRKSAPSGVAKSKPIALRLQPDMRKEAERNAVQEKKSLNLYATEMYMRGLAITEYNSKVSSSDESTSGVADNHPAFFSTSDDKKESIKVA